ncbi:hypothetical protein BV25DRAFT_1894624 [Artomyces pyxidatus]|uniref:Uncharacterized protein n=1 Tax=Artomyces pyxidatus TaxID=48021 RepID=A0ACB8SJV4_9AGAM|nr:hypothetical protein BV25DRAFT_1894624 [Artomyces pyxidatus]
MPPSSPFDDLKAQRQLRGAWKTLIFNVFKPVPALPPPVHIQLLSDPSSVCRRLPYLDHPGFQANHLPDSPLASFYRLYEYFVIHEPVAFRNEIQYFWRRHEWPGCNVPDPHDPDPLRYALFAALTEILITSFNMQINRGLPRDVPKLLHESEFEAIRARPRIFDVQLAWALQVPPLQKTVFLRDARGTKPAEE